MPKNAATSRNFSNFHHDYTGDLFNSRLNFRFDFQFNFQRETPLTPGCLATNRPGAQARLARARPRRPRSVAQVALADGVGAYAGTGGGVGAKTVVV